MKNPNCSYLLPFYISALFKWKFCANNESKYVTSLLLCRFCQIQMTFSAVSCSTYNAMWQRDLFSSRKRLLKRIVLHPRDCSSLVAPHFLIQADSLMGWDQLVLVNPLGSLTFPQAGLLKSKSGKNVNLYFPFFILIWHLGRTENVSVCHQLVKNMWPCIWRGP